MGLFSFFEQSNFVLNFCPIKPKKEKHEEFKEKIDSLGKKYRITILPVYTDYKIKNLYPITNQVDKWNIFIVGNDKTYILAKVEDLDIPNHTLITNNRGTSVLPNELNEFFDPVWDKTLSGVQLQFLMIWKEKTYFVNTYPIRNEDNEVIGANMFIRSFDLMPKTGIFLQSYNYGPSKHNLINKPLGDTIH